METGVNIFLSFFFLFSKFFGIVVFYFTLVSGTLNDSAEVLF